jgi:Phosphoesterase family
MLQKQLVTIPLFFSAYIFLCLPLIAQTAAESKIQKEANTKEEPTELPYNRFVQSAGKEIFFGDRRLENHSLDLVILPGLPLAAVEHRYGVAIFDINRKSLINNYSLFGSNGDFSLMSTYSGIKAVKIGKRIRLIWGVASSINGSFVYEVDWNGKSLDFVKAIPIPISRPAQISLPNEVELKEENGTLFLYVVENGNNQLSKIRESDGGIVWSVPTGVAPFGICLNGDRVFVSNWGGADATNDPKGEKAGVPWGYAYTDPSTGAVNNGTVSVLDSKDGHLIKNVSVGLHPNVIRKCPGQPFLFVSNGNSDHISIVDMNQLVVTDSISISPNQQINYQGSSPNGMAFSEDGKTLYVSNGMDNALAVIALEKDQNGRFIHHVKGYIPTGAYPSGLTVTGSQLIVCNLEGRGAHISSKEVMDTTDASLPKIASFNSHHQLASLSFIPVPNDVELKEYTQHVSAFEQINRSVESYLPPRPDRKPVPVPERIGEPSVFKHVVYIIKENRTYDQVLGDMKEGNGEPSLCVFGDSVTPNQHQLARDYLLLDNYYASGKCSAEGHQWTDAGMVTDYIEKNVRAWFRSYPHAQYDAMVYDKNGFIWNQALDHHKTVRIYGEACTTAFDPHLNWQAIYQLYTTHQPFACTNIATISRVRPILSQRYPGYDDPRINDQLRAEAFIAELEEFEKKSGDQWPDLMVISLPNDHTTGMAPGFPTPRAMVADNDLALGKMIEAITKSRFWDSTVVFVTEDDSQSGWDHVSAYRTTSFIISPYSHLHRTIHTNYNQLSLLRTIEQILGVPPMNSLDATATPMFDCFFESKDNKGYSTLANRINLEEMNAPISSLKGKALNYAQISKKFVHIDDGDDSEFNKVLWYATHVDHAAFLNKKQ